MWRVLAQQIGHPTKDPIKIDNAIMSKLSLRTFFCPTVQINLIKANTAQR